MNNAVAQSFVLTNSVTATDETKKWLFFGHVMTNQRSQWDGEADRPREAADNLVLAHEAHAVDGDGTRRVNSVERQALGGEPSRIIRTWEKKYGSV
jgi:hypothetical protein